MGWRSRSSGTAEDRRTGGPGDRRTGGPVGKGSRRSTRRSAARCQTRYEVDDLIAEGDKVVVRWRLLGTHLGDFRGIAPSGQRIALDGIAIYRVDGGKLMERWVVTDLYGVLEELRTSSAPV